MMVKVIAAPEGTCFAGPIFFINLMKKITVPTAAKLPMVVNIVGGTDDDVKKLTEAGFIVEKVEIKPRSWPAGLVE